MVRTARTLAGFFCLTLAFGWCVATAQAVSFEWVTVGDQGNPADTEVMTCCGDSVGTTGYGSVANTYRISKYETTNAQYATFLNAVADTDTYGLYNTAMGNVEDWSGGITRTGSSDGPRALGREHHEDARQRHRADDARHPP